MAERHPSRDIPSRRLGEPSESAADVLIHSSFLMGPFEKSKIKDKNYKFSQVVVFCGMRQKRLGPR